jgi:hypothetical protein
MVSRWILNGGSNLVLTMCTCAMGDCLYLDQKIPCFPAAAAINPCADYVTPYLNIPAVKAALHALPSIEWTECR